MFELTVPDLYDELCNKIYHKFRSNLNLPGNLNEKYITNLHYIITFQFNSMIFHWQIKTILTYIKCMQIPSFSENLV